MVTFLHCRLPLLAVWLYTALSVVCLAAPAPTPTPFAKEPLTLTHAEVLATIQHMQTLAKQAEADTAAAHTDLAAAKVELAAEHQAHVAADADAADAQKEAAALGKAAALAAAQRDAEKARADRLAASRQRIIFAFVLTVLGTAVALYFVGGLMQIALRKLVSAVASFLEGFLSFAVTKLTMLWPPLGVPVNLLLAGVRLLKR